MFWINWQKWIQLHHFFGNISSFIGDFSGFSEDYVSYGSCLKSCELYKIDDCTDRTLSYVILFRNEKVYKLFEDIFFTNYNKTSFDDRGFNGLVLTLHLNGQKVLLHLHSSTYTLHIQGKACRQCFFGFFSVLAKQLHDEINLDKNPQNSEKLTN